MAHEVPVALDHRPGDLGIVIQDRQVERDAALHTVGVQHLEHAPEADPVPVVAVGVVLHVGRRHARPRVAHAVTVGQVLVVLDVRRDPERDASAPRPLDRRRSTMGL